MKTAKKVGCTDPVCKLMKGPKGKAFGKAGVAFYTEYLKLAKKAKNKPAIEGLSQAVLEMKSLAAGKSCACDPSSDSECGCC